MQPKTSNVNVVNVVNVVYENRSNYRNFELLRDAGQRVSHVRVTPSSFPVITWGRINVFCNRERVGI